MAFFRRETALHHTWPEHSAIGHRLRCCARLILHTPLQAVRPGQSLALLCEEKGALPAQGSSECGKRRSMLLQLRLQARVPTPLTLPTPLAGTFPLSLIHILRAHET